MQMDIHKTLYPFYTTKKMPHVTVTITKNASLAAIARYISVTTIYTVGYLQIFNVGHFFSSKHCHGFQRIHKLCLYVLSKQGHIQLIYSTEQTTEHVFEYIGGNCPVALPLIVGSAAGHVSIT